MIRKVGLLLLMVLPSCFIHAQIFEGGFIVLNNGDTVRGFLQQSDGTESPKKIVFKPGTKENVSIDYNRSRVKAFFSGRSHFHRYYLSKTMDSYEFRYATSGKVPIVFDTLYLEVLQKGNTITLYKYRDNVKTRFYVLQNNGTMPLELGYRVIKDGASFREDMSFRETLTLIAQSSGKATKDLQSRINKSRYKEDALVKIARLINGIGAGKNNSFNPEGQGMTIGGGINLASLYFYDDTRIEQNATGSSSPGLWIAATYDLPTNPGTGRTIFRPELILNTGSFESKSFDNKFISSTLRVEHSFKQFNVGVGLNFIYNLYNQKKLKVFVGAGARVNYSFYDFDYSIYTEGTSGITRISNKYAEPKKLWNSWPIRAGAVINKKIEASILFVPNRVLYQLGFPYGYGIRALEVGLVYHFEHRE